MNPDGLSYLDLASEALRGGPSKLVSGYWSPGYPAMLSFALWVFRPSPGQEFPLIHFVNFVIFLLTLWAFSVFFRYWLDSTLGSEAASGDKKRYLTPFAFTTFLWFTLTFIGMEPVTPDLGVAAIVLLAAGIGCRLSLPGSSWQHYATLGFVLGVGYYFKTALFPLSLAFLAILFILSPHFSGMSRLKLLSSLMVFLLVAAPLLAALSSRAKHLSFGESGRLNYAWYVNGLLWAETPEHPEPNTTAQHPAPKLMQTPVVLEFSSPVSGTYPLWYDPSYWYAGTTVRLDLQQQITAIRQTLLDYQDIGFETAGFFAGAIVLFILILRDRLRINVFRGFSWQLAWPLTAFLMYALVHVERRFLGAFLVVFWLAVYGTLICRGDRRVTVAVCATVIGAVLIPFAFDVAMTGARSARDLAHPRPPSYQIAARGLRDLGLREGDSLAVVGYSYNCYYARCARLRVIAQIPDKTGFWTLSTPELAALAERLASIGVRALVAWDRPRTARRADWKDVNVSDSVRLSVLLISPQALRRPADPSH